MRTLSLCSVLLIGLVIFVVACADAEEQINEGNATSSPSATAQPSASGANTAPPLGSQATPLPTGVEDTLAFVEEDQGYSFEYPASWFLIPPTVKEGDVTLYSYDFRKVPPEDVGKPVPLDRLKAFFWVAEGVDQPIDQWLAERKSNPGEIDPTIIVSRSPITLAGSPGVLEIIDSGGIQSAGYFVAMGAGRVFVVNVVPHNSELREQFDIVLESVRFAH